MNKRPLRKRRTSYLKVMVTAEEKAKFKKLANSRQTDVSELIRQLLHSQEQAA